MCKMQSETNHQNVNAECESQRLPSKSSSHITKHIPLGHSRVHQLHEDRYQRPGRECPIHSRSPCSWQRLQQEGRWQGSRYQAALDVDLRRGASQPGSLWCSTPCELRWQSGRAPTPISVFSASIYAAYRIVPCLNSGVTCSSVCFA
jgi:hypothetical protein